MSQKYPGGFITKSPTLPSGSYETSPAKGIWTLDQAMQFKLQGNWPIVGNQAPPTVIGQAYGGGFYAGQIGVSSVATHYVIVGPVASAEDSYKAWKNAQTTTAGADSDINGPQNTADMVADGNSTVYPAAHFCNDLVIGGYSDWYMPAKNELEICYYSFKPGTDPNDTSSGINPNAVPARASNYTAGTPAQTSVTIFQANNAEAYGEDQYWTSTEANATRAWKPGFSTGVQYFYPKTNVSRVRAIRRVAV